MKNKGITLIALIVTIIIMLILSGVVLNLTIGTGGIFKEAKKAKEEILIQEGKEKIELAINELAIPKLADGTKITSEDILSIANDEINVLKSNEFPVYVKYRDKYNYIIEEINGDLMVKNVSEIDEVIEDENISKTFIPKIKEITDSGFTVAVEEKYIYDNNGNKNKINRYEYYVGNIKYESTESEYKLTNVDNLNVPIYVIAYDNANNSRISNIVEIVDVEGKAFANNNEAAAYMAFDKNPESYWDGGNIDSYIGYEFEEPIECTQVKIKQPYNNDVIKDFKIEYSDDNINYYNASNGTFTFQKTKDVQTFKLNSDLGKHKYWRYQNLTGYRSESYCAISELEFWTHNKLARIQLTKQMTSNNSVEGKIFTNNNEVSAYLAFDKDTNTYWDGENIDSYIGYEFEEPVECAEVQISQPYYLDVIKDFKIEYSDDNVNYYNASDGIFTFQIAQNDIAQTFKLNPNLGKHKYWRYQNISGYRNETNCAISELKFYQVIKLFSD